MKRFGRRPALCRAGLTALWYSSGDDTPYVGAGIGAPQMIMEAAGLDNVAADVEDTWTSMGWEAIVAADPDVIVLVDAAWNTARDSVSTYSGELPTGDTPIAAGESPARFAAYTLDTPIARDLVPPPTLPRAAIGDVTLAPPPPPPPKNSRIAWPS